VPYLVGPGRLGHEAAAVEVDEQPGGARLLLHPGQVGRGDGGGVDPRIGEQLFAVLKGTRQLIIKGHKATNLAILFQN